MRTCELIQFLFNVVLLFTFIRTFYFFSKLNDQHLFVVSIFNDDPFDEFLSVWPNGNCALCL